MALDLQTSMTMRDIALEVAEEAGMVEYPDSATDNRPQLPSDPADLDRIKRCVARGLEMFYKADPDWSFKDAEYTLTVTTTGTQPDSINNDPTRYRLPPRIQSQPAAGCWVIEADHTHGHRCDVVGHDQIRLKQAQSDNYSGPPQLCAFVTPPDDDAVQTGRMGPECVIWPTPDKTYQMHARFRVYPPRIIDLDARHWCGRMHDEAIIAACKLVWIQSDNPSAEQQYQLRYEQQLASSRQEDLRLRQEVVHRMNDQLGLTRDHRVRPARRGELIINGTASGVWL